MDLTLTNEVNFLEGAMKMEALNKKIKIEKQLDVTDLAGEKVMIDFESGKYFMIKGAGNDIWDMMKDGITMQEIIDGLLQVYDVDEPTCRESVVKFIEQMKEYGFISYYA